jgi:hypothetical protein
MPSARQSLVALAIGAVLLAAVGWQVAAALRRGVDAGFWFEAVSYDRGEPMVERLGGPLTADELARIAAIARSEVDGAFAGLALDISGRRDATYRVRVVQELQNVRAPKYPGPAGESRVFAGLGGQGAVNFRLMVSSAVVYAPEGADRETFIQGIGRGIGRTAVHEFTHQLLNRSRIVDSDDDPLSYEYRSADRPAHFYGTLHWAHARPTLERRLGTRMTN